MEEHLKIIRNENPEFRKLWNSFLQNNNNAGPFYSYLFLSQMIEKKSSISYTNCSFIIIQKNEPIAVVPLIIEESGPVRSFSSDMGFNTFYGPLLSCSYNRAMRRKIRAITFEEIDAIAVQYRVGKAMLTIDPAAYYTDDEYYNFLLEYGFFDASIATQFIELTEGLKILKSQRRKSYKALINRGLKTYSFFVMNSKNVDYEIHELYRAMHAKASGRVTRSKKSFDLQFERVKCGNATMIGARFQDRIVQIDYFDNCNGYIYYSSTANDPDFDETDVPISHALLWYSIEYFKRAGFKYFEIGWQQFGPQLFDQPIKKNIAISFFKRGFGGKIVPLYRGIKYYDKNLMKKEIEDNLNNLLQLTDNS